MQLKQLHKILKYPVLACLYNDGISTDAYFMSFEFVLWFCFSSQIDIEGSNKFLKALFKVRKF